VPTSLAALSHDDVRSDVESLAYLVDGLHLGDQRNAGHADAVGKRARITKRQHDRCRLLRQCRVEQFGVTGQAPRDEAESDSCAAGLADFRSQPFGVAITDADQAQAARGGDRRSEPPPGDQGHRREQDRVFDPEEFGETGVQ
jgi:hypothetical protein